MKTVTLLLGLACCVGLLILQQHRFAVQSARQDQAIALVQSRYEASEQENRALRMAAQAKAHTRTALVQAVAISARYRQMPATPKRTAAR